MKSMGIFLVTLATMAVFLGGCCGHGTTKVEVPPTTTTTTGQQLIDLQKAFDNGAITKDQYEKMKQDIIDKSGK